MRILQLRFKNLNSLVGEWEIDLTHPAFASDGIFAITGPTGSGKTTILDAICLALYGRTPRLNKVTKSGNEIMSRQTGECFAEVTFETQTGRFRCHWSQHRARKKPDGELQLPKHEIADADSGRILEAKLRGVAEQIEVTTGMDFDRFTRSMLLAQGGFAVFLQAVPDERAPILEQITGTEIYSQISICVHERWSEERKKLDILLAELAGMQLLSEEDERQLGTILEQKTVQETELSQRVAQKNQAITWLDGITRLEQELELIKKQKQDWQTRREAFAPEHEKLQRATRALELAGDHAGLTSVRREQETDRRNHVECLEMVPNLEERAKLAEEARKLASEHHDNRKAEQNKAAPIIRRAREFDLKIREKEAPIKTAADVVTGLEKSLSGLRSKQDEDTSGFDSKKKTLEELLQALAETQVDEALIEQLAGICNRFDALKTLQAQKISKQEEVNAAGDLVTEATQACDEQAEILKAWKCNLESSRGSFTQKQVELENSLENLDLSEWRNSLSGLTKRKSLLDKVSEASRSLGESRQSLDELGKRHDVLIAKKSNLTEQIQTQGEVQASMEREMSLLEAQLSLLKKIQSFKEARHQLQDGEPCPLCGAKEHPFAEGNTPAIDDTTLALTNVRRALKAANDAVANLKVKQAEVVKDLEQIATQKKECADKIADFEAQIKQGCESLSIDGSGHALDEMLQLCQKEDADKLGHATRIVQAAEAMEKEILALRESLDKTRESVALLEREAQSAAHQKDSSWQQLDRLQMEAEVLDEQQNNSLNELTHEVSDYGVETLSIDVWDKVQGELIARRDKWIARQKERSELDAQVTALEIRIGHQTEQIRKSDSELINQRDLLSNLRSERDALSNDRRELFGDKSPDDEETHFATAIETAEKEVDASRQVFNTASQALANLKTRVEELDKSMTGRATELKSSEDAFLVRLRKFDFADEASYQMACLPEGERNTLVQQAQKLANEQTELASKERDKATLLESEQQKKATDEPRDDLIQALAGLVANQKELQQEIGGIRQKLKDNENLKQRQRERVKVIDAQKRECSRWDLLHEIIGSADGKKYRNFAQGLTFEMMIGHANRQLQKMTDRYLLIRDDAQPLELNVIDNYQAGEVRSTKNLSGGECFIVSLSLALGLSHMASKNVRVDSLFLDEGFGTLDEDALDTALETLSGLQQDGKLIGVISHVPALKERIATQIQVTPQTGGISVISGPGCRESGALH